MQNCNPKYDLVVFDWDGTVMDTTATIAAGFRHAAAELGYRVPTEEEVRSVIGLDWPSAISKIVPSCPVEEHEHFREVYWKWYVPHEKDVVIFPGMQEIIVGLKKLGVKRAIATGKSREGLNRVFALTGLESEFESTQTASECLPKPNAEMLEKIEIELGIPASRTVMIGDTTHDVHMAHRYGCDVVAMTYGASTLDDLKASEPTYLCDTVRDLAKILGVEGLLDS